MEAQNNGGDNQNLPIKQVLQMRDKGFDNNKIIQQLQSQGFSSSVIFDALNRADMEQYEDGEGSQHESLFTDTPQGLQRQRGQQGSQQSGRNISDEELIESVIEEKWQALLDDMKKVIAWKKRTEEDMKDLKNQMESVKETVSHVQGAMNAKLEKYDDTMSDVGNDVKAMEKTFQQALPKFTETVSELATVVKELKKNK